MLLPDDLKQNIEFLLEKSGVMNAAVKYRTLHPELLEQIELAASEVSIVALVTADAIDRLEEPETVLMRGLVSFRLRQIAFHCLDIQETEDTAEIRGYLQAVDEQCGHISEIVGIPKPVFRDETDLVPTGQPTIEDAVTALQIQAETDEDVEKLRAEIRALRELLTSLVMERDHLETVVLRDIEAAYMRELGGLEAEIYRAECEIRILKKRLAMMQACVNRDQPIVEVEIEMELKKSVEEFQKAYEDFVRRVNAAHSYSELRLKQRKMHEDAPSEGPTDKTDVEQECKRLYRKLVKAMHPDLHPDQDERTKALFKRAIIAYKAFDLKTLREIDAMMSGDIPDTAELLLEELRKEKARLLELIRAVRAEIRVKKNSYPYTKKWVLEDPERLEAEKKRLAERLVRATETVKVYQERIERMRERNG